MRIVLSLVLAGLVTCSTVLHSEEQEKPEKSLVKKIGPHTYRVGLVEINSKTREISIPVIVNQREGGPIEYILVTETGKVHEAILTTAARPLNVQIALKLLKFQVGTGDIFDKLLPSEDRKVKGEKSGDHGEAVDVLIRWKDGEKEKTSFINEWVIDGESIKSEGDMGTPMPEHPWFYTGSVIYEGRFLAEAEGSIIAIYLDPVSLFNTTVPGAEIDERWGANHKAIPEIGTKATLLIRPMKK